MFVFIDKYLSSLINGVLVLLGKRYIMFIVKLEMTPKQTKGKT